MLLENMQLDMLAHETNTANIRDLINARAWEWFYANTEQVIGSVFIFTIRVKHVKVIFERLFGPELNRG